MAVVGNAIRRWLAPRAADGGVVPILNRVPLRLTAMGVASIAATPQSAATRVGIRNGSRVWKE